MGQRKSAPWVNSLPAPTCVLILDELGQVAPQDAGDIAYTLGNGQSKARMTRQGSARPASNWRLLFLSTGEIGLAEHVAQAGEQIRAGQEVRLLDVPSEAGRGLGLFENLHGAPSPQEFADILQKEAEASYGTAAETLLARLTESADELNRATSAIKAIMQRFIDDYVPDDAHGQVYRAACRFGFVAGVGEYCIEIGVLPWQPGEATAGVRDCFIAWLECRGGNQASEEVRALAQVRRFLESHGESRFSPMKLEGIEESHPRTIQRAGFRKDSAYGGTEYLVLPEAYRTDLCCGFDPKLVTMVLRDRGFLEIGKDGKSQVMKRLPGNDVATRVYVIKPSIFHDDKEEAVA